MVYVYHTFWHQVDEEEFGGLWELAKEGMMTSFALFLVSSVHLAALAKFHSMCSSLSR